jgi:hypothetical protein
MARLLGIERLFIEKAMEKKMKKLGPMEDAMYKRIPRGYPKGISQGPPKSRAS